MGFHCRRGGRPWAFPFVLLPVLLLPLDPAAAQAVVGRLLDGETGSPVEGALVLLEQEGGGDRGGMLTNAVGRFLLRAPTPGSYRVRAERIGYQTVRSELLSLGEGESIALELRALPAAIELEELRVVGEQQCIVRPGEGMEVARVWEEARKALTVQAWTEAEGLYRFRLVHYERDLDPSARLVSSEKREVWEAFHRNPIRSLPVEELLTQGFIRQEKDGGFVFYGPDAAVLLSDPFLDTHCFRLGASSSDASLVGLSFEPIRRRPVADILGTLWLDRGTGKLRFLEFAYDWAPWEEAVNAARGQVELQEMPNGAWIIRKWWIRMPQVARLVGPGATTGTGFRLVGIREVGGEVLNAAAMDRTVVEGTARGQASGIVWDSLHHRPLSQATVFLSGTGYSAVSDSAGRFLLLDLPEGGYRLSFSHHLLDSLGVYPEGVEVAVIPGAMTEADLGVPSPQGLLDALCGAFDREEGEGAITGVVRHRETGAPWAGATVRLEWSRFSAPSGREIVEEIQGVEVTTSSSGRFHACGVPPGSLVRVQASHGREEGASREVEVSRSQVVALSLTLGGRAPLP